MWVCLLTILITVLHSCSGCITGHKHKLTTEKCNHIRYMAYGIDEEAAESAYRVWFESKQGAQSLEKYRESEQGMIDNLAVLGFGRLCQCKSSGYITV